MRCLVRDGILMSNTRRDFLQQSSAVLAMGVLGGGAVSSAAQPAIGTREQDAPTGAAEIQVPKMKFGNAEIGRLVLGVNPLYGFAHYNNNFSGGDARVVHARSGLRSDAPGKRFRDQCIQLG